MLKRPLIILLISLFAYDICLGQACEVTADSLKGKYEGACKKGKADGTGIATGTDSYNGEFKSGFPNGKGKYTWHNGDWYDGGWQKGKMAGKGEMHYKRSNSDSIVIGYWEKGQYIGKHEKPYEIISRGSAISLDIKYSKDTKNEINIAASNVRAKPELTGVRINYGNYANRIDNTSSSNKNFYSFQQVQFPLRAVFIFAYGEIEIEFYEPGTYTVDISF